MERTFGDIQNAAKECEKNNYVYVWFFSKDDCFVPFTLGLEAIKTDGKTKLQGVRHLEIL